MTASNISLNLNEFLKDSNCHLDAPITLVLKVFISFSQLPVFNANVFPLSFYIPENYLYQKQRNMKLVVLHRQLDCTVEMIHRQSLEHE